MRRGGEAKSGKNTQKSHVSRIAYFNIYCARVRRTEARADGPARGARRWDTHGGAGDEGTPGEGCVVRCRYLRSRFAGTLRPMTTHPTTEQDGIISRRAGCGLVELWSRVGSAGDSSFSGGAAASCPVIQGRRRSNRELIRLMKTSARVGAARQRRMKTKWAPRSPRIARPK